MRPSDRLKDVDALEYFKMMLEKTEENPEIKKAFAKFGYTDKILNEGRELLRSTREIFEEDSRKKDAFALCRASLRRKRKEAEERYRLHRKKAKIIAGGNDLLTDALAIKGPYERRLLDWMEKAGRFYREIDGEPETQKVLSRLKLTKKDAERGLADIKELEVMLAKYMYLTGESKLSTVHKRKAFTELHNWKKQFYAVAKMALKDKPELLETLYPS